MALVTISAVGGCDGFDLVFLDFLPADAPPFFIDVDAGAGLCCAALPSAMVVAISSMLRDRTLELERDRVRRTSVALRSAPLFAVRSVAVEDRLGPKTERPGKAARSGLAGTPFSDGQPGRRPEPTPPSPAPSFGREN